MNNTVKGIFAILFAAAMAVGCDFLDDDKRTEREYMLQRENEERAKQEQKSRAEALKVYLGAKCRLIEEKAASLTGELKSLRDDADSLEKEVASVLSMRGEDGKTLSYEAQVLRVLKNKTVNEIAVKYLAGGFSLHAEKFIEKIRVLRSDERKYREALKKSNDQFDSSIEMQKDWVKVSKSRRDAEQLRLEREIADLEKKRSQVRREMSGSPSHRRECIDKMNDYESEISNKRRQLNYLRNPDANRSIESRAANRAIDVQRDAARVKEEMDHNIHRRMKPTTSAVEIADDINKETVEKLRKEIKARIDDREKEQLKLNKKLEISKEIQIEIPVCDFAGLNRLKMRADREL